MPTWIYFALATLALWGTWGVAVKLADSAGYGPIQIFLVGNIISAVIAVIAFLLMREDMEWDAKPLGWAAAAGLAGTSAFICFLFAMSKGKASIVVPFTSMYPVVTLVLSFLLLRERITWTQGLGVGCAMLAIFFLTRPA